MTIAQAMTLIHRELEGCSDAPALEAQWLLSHVVGQRETSWLHAHSNEQLTRPQQCLWRRLVKARQTGQPLAYILGEWDFYGRPFYVTPDVLVPRPSTEELVDTALRYLYRTVRLDPKGCWDRLVVADIGTGSGCIAVTLVVELKKLKLEHKVKMVATDIAREALAVARRNAVRHGVADEIEFLRGDMLAPLAGRQLDLIVSNPPYVPTCELAALWPARSHTSYKSSSPLNSPLSSRKEKLGLAFEPRRALDGGRDGQRYIKIIKTAGCPAVMEGTRGQIYTYCLHQKVP